MRVMPQLKSFFRGVAGTFVTVPAPSSNSAFPREKYLYY
jgi:hypothetical protein